MTKEVKERLTVRLPSELNKRLTEYLAPRGICKNAFILGLINREMEKVSHSDGAMEVRREATA